jgi:hypothetical protein
LCSLKEKKEMKREASAGLYATRVLDVKFLPGLARILGGKTRAVGVVKSFIIKLFDWLTNSC